MQQTNSQPNRFCLNDIEAEQHQIAPLQADEEETKHADANHLPEITICNTKNVALDDAFQIHLRGIEPDQKQTKGEKCGEDNADDRVFANL